LSVLLCSFAIGPTWIYAYDKVTAQDRPLSTIEIRYHMPGAGEVALVWGIDGWKTIPEEIRPAGTALQEGAMHTPMERQDETFMATVQAPTGAMIDYGFMITKTRTGVVIGIWDSNHDPVLAAQDGVIDAQTRFTLVQNQAIAITDNIQITQEIRYRLPRADEVSFVWGINGWLPLPEEARPAGTELVEGVMRTPMERLDDAFAIQVQVPAGATMDYGFLISKTHRGTTVEVWDVNGDLKQGYHTTAEQDGVSEVQAPPPIAQEIARADPGILPPWLGLASAIGACALLGIVAARTWTVRRSRGAVAGSGARERRAVMPFQVSRLPYLFDLLRELVVRDIKIRYKRSVLGMAWSLLDPLFHMLVFTFLSRRVLSLQIPNYPSFVFVGTLAWSWFTGTVVAATGAITGSRELVRRPGFPVVILPVATVTTTLIHFLLALVVPLIFFLVRGGRLTGTILTLPLVIAPQFALILGLSYLAATFQVTFRDTQNILGVLFRLLYFLTPIFYDASMVPARYEVLYRLNPMFYLITAYRTILIHGTLPDFPALLIVGALGGALLWIGHAIFTRASYRFVEEL
jgi:lipopolysaccharide transport system permease protein